MRVLPLLLFIACLVWPFHSWAMDEPVDLNARLEDLLGKSTPPGKVKYLGDRKVLEITFPHSRTRLWSNREHGHCFVEVLRRERTCYEVAGRCTWADPKHPHASVWPVMAGRFCAASLGRREAKRAAQDTADAIARLLNLENRSKPILPSACDLLTRQEVAQALNRPVLPGIEQDPNPYGQSLCRFPRRRTAARAPGPHAPVHGCASDRTRSAAGQPVRDKP